MITDIKDITSFKWATVAGTSPVSIKLDGDTSPLALVPDSLVDPASLKLGDRVRVELSLRKAVIHGVASGTMDRGTTAQRDAQYPAPGTAGERVALADRSVRWFNTEKGWEEQYFAQWDDAGATPRTSAQTFGWKPLGRPLVHATAIVPTGGSAADHGSHVAVGAGGTGVLLQGIFTDDFEDYEIIIRATDNDAVTLLTMRTAIGAVVNSSVASYGRNAIQSDGALSGSYTADSYANIALVSTLETVVQGAIFSPKNGAIRTQWRFDSHNPANGTQVRLSGHTGFLDASDGIWFGLTNFASARIQVFGIGR